MAVTATFIIHLLTFYNLTIQNATNMWMLESSVYGTYFIMKLGYLVAVLTDGTFTHPLVTKIINHSMHYNFTFQTCVLLTLDILLQEVVSQLCGAVLYNVLGLIELVGNINNSVKEGYPDFSDIDFFSFVHTALPFVKGVLALLTSMLYYIEIFQS